MIHKAERIIHPGQRTYFIAEVSANHNQSFERALAIIHAAKKAGADAVKIQTYTADTITIDSDKEYFLIKGTLWDGMTLHQLYRDAYTPWEWQPKIKEVVESLGMDFLSSPFDPTAVTFLESIGVAAYKVASPEIIDIPLLRLIGSTRKPVIMSTGMATLSEIDEAVRTLRDSGTIELLLMKCTSAYPAPASEMNLRTIPLMAQSFGVPVGLSDHTMGHEVALAAVALGACAIEKHFTLARSDGGLDSGFSMEPAEFKAMVDAVRIVERAVGKIHYQPSPNEVAARLYRRSLFVVSDLKAGEVITEDKVRSIRPGHGLHPRYLPDILGRCALRDVEKGTPFSWGMLDHSLAT
jgi:pseudaminic acid synthase